MESVNIDPDQLRDQASQSRDGAAAVAEAQSAVGSMNLGGGAFGVMCAFLIPPAMAVTGAASLLMSSAKDMLDREASALEETAGDFTTTDDSRAQKFDGADTGENTSGAYR